MNISYPFKVSVVYVSSLIATFALLAPSLAHAIELTCAEDKTTNGHFCFSEKDLRESNGIRTAPLYTGGPNGVSKTQYHIAANCSTGVMHLKDRQGVSFAGSGPGEGTTQSRQLRRYVCEANLPVSKKK
jgi:hypothetical protein